MRFIETELKEVILVEPAVFHDPRGWFFETYHARKYAQGRIHGPFVQDNYSHSVHGTLRGLHYQLKHGQGKLVTVVEGTVFDVAVDIRRGSPTFGNWLGIELSAQNKRQLYIPPGFAHGFCVLSETAGVIYKCTDFYAPDDEGGIVWDDRTINIHWPVAAPCLSDKDKTYPTLAELPDNRLPTYAAESL